MGSANNEEPFDRETLRRVVLTCVVIGITIYAGYRAGVKIATLTNDEGVINVLGKSIKWDLGALGLVYVLSVIEKLFKLFKALADYVSTSGIKIIALLPDCGALLAVAAYATAAGSLVVTSQRSEPIPSLAKVVYLSKVSGEPVAAFSFLFSKVGSATLRHDDPQIDRLTKLVASLNSCVGKGLNQDVVIQIQGFADANEFSPPSEDRNRDLANQRAKSLNELVKDKIGSQPGFSKLTLEPNYLWNSFTEMKTSPRWLEVEVLDKTRPSRDQGLFDRRADILLWRAGVCQPLLESNEANQGKK